MNQQDMLELGAVAIGALALLVVLRRGGSTAPVAVPEVQSVASPYGQPPTYLGVNQPTNAGSGNSLGLSAVSAASQGSGSNSGPSCACQSSPVQFASVDAFGNYLASVDETIVNSYESSIMQAMPSWMAQFINNTFAPDETAAAQGRFSSLATWS